MRKGMKNALAVGSKKSEKKYYPLSNKLSLKFHHFPPCCPFSFNNNPSLKTIIIINININSIIIRAA